MVINKEWEDVLKAIFKLIKIKLINELKIEIPPNIYDELGSDYKTVKNSHIEYLSTHYIIIKALSTNNERQIKIWFGPKRKLKSENEIIIEFEYAPKIIFYLIKIIEADKVQIDTNNNLYERDSIFSQPFSTFELFLDD